MSSKKISIVTPCFNSEKYIEQTLQSVLAEATDDLEHIVVDADSTDKTVEILRRYEGKYDLRWISEKDRGIYDALNKAIGISKGDYIGWLNADDVYNEGAIKKCLSLIQENIDIDIYSGDALLFEDSGEVLKIYRHYRSPTFSSARLNIAFAHLNSCFISKSVFEELGLFNDTYGVSADRDYMLKMMEYGYSVRHLEMVVCNYRLHPNSQTFNRKKPVFGGAMLAMDHPARIEIENIAWERIKISRDFGVLKWAISKLIKYKFLSVIYRFWRW